MNKSNSGFKKQVKVNLRRLFFAFSISAFALQTKKTIVFFVSIFILLTRRKATEALIHRVSNDPDLLPEMPRHCCPLEI